jgi:hypothetical protein
MKWFPAIVFLMFALTAHAGDGKKHISNEIHSGLTVIRSLMPSTLAGLPD